LVKRLFFFAALVFALVAYNGVTANEERPDLDRIGFAPVTITGGGTSTLTVKLTGEAPRGGVTLSLESDRPDLISLPATVMVESGRSSTNISVPASKVDALTVVTVRASDGANEGVALLNVRPRN
jgi:hypothetical protein